MLLLALFAPAADAATLAVPGDHATVAAALAAASPGDEIVVDSGTYTAETTPILVDKTVSIRSTGGSAATTLPMVHVGAVTATIEGFTLVADMDPYEADDCAIALRANDSTLTASDLVLRPTSAVDVESLGLSALGGTLDVTGVQASGFSCRAAVYTDGTALTLADAELTANEDFTPSCGERCVDTLLVAPLVVSGGSGTVTDATIADNVATRAGAAWLYATDVTFEGGDVRGNSGVIGAIHALAKSDPTTLTVRDAVFTDNIGMDAGDVVLQIGTLTVERTTFDGGTGLIGGGIAVYGTATVTDSTFVGGVAETYGGAIYVESGSAVSVSGSTFDGTTAAWGGAIATGGEFTRTVSPVSLTVADSTFTATSATDSGGGIAFLPGADLVIEDVTVDGTTAVEKGGFLFSVDEAMAWPMLANGSVVRVDGVTATGTTATTGGFAYVAPSDEASFAGVDVREAAAIESGGAFRVVQPHAFALTCSRVCASAAADGAILSLEEKGKGWSLLANDLLVENASTGPAIDLVGAPNLQVEFSTLLGNEGSAAIGGSATAIVLWSSIVKDSAIGVDVLPTAAAGGYNLWSGNGTDGSTGSGFPLLSDQGADPVWRDPFTSGDCDAPLFLALGSPGRDQGDPLVGDLDGTRSDVGAWGGPGACDIDADDDGWYASTDCADGDDGIHPHAVEIPYDGIDQDCDGADLCDVDGDGAIAVECDGDDCDDADPRVHPGAADVPEDGIDQDCDGADGALIGDTDAPEACETEPVTWLQGGCSTGGLAPSAWLALAGLLALRRRRIGLLALVGLAACEPEPPEEVPCTDEAVDADQDGWFDDEDCDDADASRFPGNWDGCDGVDNDCDELVDEDAPDTDGDGVPDCEDVEVCNGVDDDGDGLVDEDLPDADADGVPDCFDGWCDVDRPDPGAVADDPTCAGEIAVVDPWAATVEWSWTATKHQDVASTPTTGDLDGDGIPEVIVVSTDPSTTYGQLYALDGATGAEEWTVTPSLGFLPFPGATVADIDADGELEVVVFEVEGTAITGVTAFEADGTAKWKSDTWVRYLECRACAFTTRYFATVADLDADGTPEVIADHLVLDGLTGKAEAVLPYPFETFVTNPMTGDVDGDGDQEILFAMGLYDETGAELVTYPVASKAWTWTLFLQADGDDAPEVAISAPDGVHLFEPDGTLIRTLDPKTSSQRTAPCVADFDGDGTSEIAWADTLAGELGAWELDGTAMWTAKISDPRGLETCAAFDFDGDGAAEIVHADEAAARIYRGSDGAVLIEDTSHTGAYGMGSPAIADVDGDGGAEVILANNDLLGTGIGRRGLWVYGHAGAGWAPTKGDWGEHGYREGALPEPWLDGNLVRARSIGESPQADLAPVLADDCAAACQSGGVVRIAAQVANGGAATAPAGTVVALYATDGSTSDLLGLRTVQEAIPAGTTSEALVFTVLWEEVQGLDLVLVADDDGSGAGALAECDEADNTLTVPFDACP